MGTFFCLAAFQAVVRVTNRDCGFVDVKRSISDEGKAQAFADKINALTRDPEKARAFGLAGRERCIEEFDWSKIAAETVDVYRRAIEVHKG